MRVLVIGGTRFIGRAASEALLAAGHELLIIHRGENEPETLTDARHIHVPRAELAQVRDEIAGFVPAVALDTLALTRDDADIALRAIPRNCRTVVLSSCDVYRAYTSRDAGIVTDAVPLDETAALRSERYPYRGRLPGLDDYEKLDVEAAYRARGATILRLGFVYGPHDAQRREEFILRRVRAGRVRIPFGPGNWLLSRSYVVDAADAIRRAVEMPAAAAETMNIADARGVTVGLWAQQILTAAQSAAELVNVPARSLPQDMAISAAIQQHMLIDSSRAHSVLGWEPSDPTVSVRASVEWHLANPPAPAHADFSADDAALAAAR
ncbi:MAG TPA: NAD-dependent epimerase/dehydratase family protein [Tepidiformaceae bacterium]|nr:NAD-dependent epimerase/dehydratase family protein [Tepidiformaceae bacterium]